jgi:hypothetical protein
VVVPKAGFGALAEIIEVLGLSVLISSTEQHRASPGAIGVVAKLQSPSGEGDYELPVVLNIYFHFVMKSAQTLTRVLIRIIVIKLQA